MEDQYLKFKNIIRATYQGNNEDHQQSLYNYEEMIKEIPVELASFHFQILSETKIEQEKTLSLILLGRYFKLLKLYRISLSNEGIEMIKQLLISLFQFIDLSQYQFNIISNDILILFDYIDLNWQELPDLLFEHMNSENPKVSSSATNCFSQLVHSYSIDTEKYFDILYENIVIFLNPLKEFYLPKVSSYLRLFYILAKFHYFQPLENFIPILNEIPNYLLLCKNYHQIIIDFYEYINFDSFIFQSSFQLYFKVLINMISDPEYFGIGNTIILILDNLIKTFYIDFEIHANSIFMLYVGNLIHSDFKENLIYSLNNLSNLYGNNENFVVTVLEYIKNILPDQNAYIIFSSTFDGIKSFILNSDSLLNEILDIYLNGYVNESTKVCALLSFTEIIKKLSKNDINNSNEFTGKIISILYEIMKAEDNVEMIFLELNLLKKILKKYCSNLQSVICNIIQILENLINLNGPIEILRIIFDCYKYIAISYKNEFAQFSDQLKIKMLEFIDNPKELESQFFLCLDILPVLYASIEYDIFVEFLMKIFNFLFTEIYDENGNENEDNSLSEDERCIIINFFLFCINEETIKNNHKIIEIILFIAYNNASNEPKYEYIESELNMKAFKNCFIMLDPTNDKMILIGFDQISKIKNSISILNIFFDRTDIQLSEKLNEIKENFSQLLNSPFIRKILFNTELI